MLTRVQKWAASFFAETRASSPAKLLHTRVVTLEVRRMAREDFRGYLARAQAEYDIWLAQTHPEDEQHALRSFRQEAKMLDFGTLLHPYGNSRTRFFFEAPAPCITFSKSERCPGLGEVHLLDGAFLCIDCARTLENDPALKRAKDGYLPLGWQLGLRLRTIK